MAAAKNEFNLMGLHENSSEIDFVIFADKGDQYLSDAFSPMKKYCF